MCENVVVLMESGYGVEVLLNLRIDYYVRYV